MIAGQRSVIKRVEENEDSGHQETSGKETDETHDDEVPRELMSQRPKRVKEPKYERDDGECEERRTIEKPGDQDQGNGEDAIKGVKGGCEERRGWSRGRRPVSIIML